MALIIAEEILEVRWYNDEFIDVSWAECELRKYLNNDFYHSFSKDDKARIVSIQNSNPGNPWFKTNGGPDTLDKIFLLSLVEVCKYFGDSIGNLMNKGSQKWLIDDENNQRRRARYDNRYYWWRLRSPGYYGRTSASVNANGNVYVRGNGVYGSPKDGGGVRPALWLNLED